MESLNLVKGQNIKIAAGLTLLAIGLGWDAKSGRSIDLDASALPYGENGKVQIGNVCYFGRLTALNGAVQHSGDNLTGAGDGDDEVIKINLEQVPADVKGFAIVVNSFSGQNFGEVSNAFMRAFDGTTNEELAKYDMSEDHSGAKYLELGRVYRHDGGWKFKATGTSGTENNLQKIAENFVA